MIIAIDASRAVKPQPTGTELYSARIIEYLAKIDHQTTYYLYSPSEPPANFPKLPNNFHWKIIPFPRLWTHLRLMIALWQDKPDILFVPSHVMPVISPVKTVVTLHDIAYDLFPEAYTWFSRWYNHFTTLFALKRAAAIIVPSQATSNDLVKLYQAKAQNITVIPHGFDPSDTPTASNSQKIKDLQPFFVSIGRLEVRKNTARLIEAFGLFRQQQPTQKEKLILIGKPGHGYEEVQQAIQKLPHKIARDIIETGYISDTERQAYLELATAFVYPSLYEGFGFPLLDAMAAGTPIIAGDSSSIPEVVDDAAILVDPQSTEDLAQALAIMATNDLSGQQVAARGKERLKDFDWQRTAERTLQAIKEAL